MRYLHVQLSNILGIDGMTIAHGHADCFAALFDRFQPDLHHPC